MALAVVLEEAPFWYCASASANAGRARSAAERRVIVVVFDSRSGRVRLCKLCVSCVVVDGGRLWSGPLGQEETTFLYQGFLSDNMLPWWDVGRVTYVD